MADTTTPVDTGGIPQDAYNTLNALATAPPGGTINMPPAQSTASQPVDTGGIPPDAYKQLDALAVQPLQVSKTGKSVEAAPGQNKFFQELANDVSNGSYGVTKDFTGLSTAFNLMSNEDMDKMNKSLPQYQAQHDPDDWTAKHFVPQLFQTMGRQIASSIPSAVVTGAGMAAAGITAVTVGAPVGAAVLVGGALTGGAMALGGMYQDQIARKVDPTTARFSAVITGSVATAIGMVNLGQGGKLAGSVAKDVMESAPIKAAMMQAANKFINSTGLNVALGQFQGVLTSALKYATTRASTKATPYTIKEWRDDHQAMLENVFSTAPIFTAAAEGAGAVVGAAGKPYHNQLQEMATRFDLERQAIEDAIAAKATKEQEGKIEEYKQKVSDSIAKAQHIAPISGAHYLQQIGVGTPGLHVDTQPHGTRISYHGPQGEPIAAVDIDNTKPIVASRPRAITGSTHADISAAVQWFNVRQLMPGDNMIGAQLSPHSGGMWIATIKNVATGVVRNENFYPETGTTTYSPGVRSVSMLAADKTAGLLTGRAVLAILEEMRKQDVSDVGSSVTQDTANLVGRYLKQKKFTPGEQQEIADAVLLAMTEHEAEQIDFTAQTLSKLINDVKPNKDGSVNLNHITTQLRGLAVKEFQGAKPVSLEASENKPQNFLHKFLRTYNTGNANAHGILNTAAQDMPPDQRQVPTLVAELLHDVVQNVETSNRESLERLDKTLAKATNTKPDQLQKLISGLASKKVKFKYNRQDGKLVDYQADAEGNPATELQLLQHIMWAQDKDAQEGLRANGYTLYGDNPGGINWEQAGMDALSPDAKKILHGLISDYNAAHTVDPIVKAYREKNGGDDLEIINYRGRLIRRVAKSVNDAQDFEDQLKQKLYGHAPNKSTINPVNTIEREENAHPLIPTDAYMNAVINKYFASRLIHTWRAAEVLHGVFNHPDVRTVLENKYGKRFVGELDAAISDSLHGPGTKVTGIDRLINWNMQRFGVVKLGGNLLRIPMHTVQLLNVAIAKNMSPKTLMTGIAHFNLDPIKNMKEFAERPFAKNRYADESKTFLAHVREHKPAGTAMQKFNHIMMLPLPIGDFLGAAPAWHAVLKAEEARGLPYEDAADAADRAINNTMYSSSPDQMSNFNAGRTLHGDKVFHTDITKLIGVASQIPTKMWQMQIDSMRDAVNHPTAANYAKAGQTIMTVHIANAMFEAIKTGWLTATSKDDKRVTRAWLDLVTSLITGPAPVLEHLGISAAGLQLRNWALGREDKPAEFKTYPEAVYNDVMKLFEAWNHEAALGKEPMENPTVQHLFLKAFNETVTGLPEAPFNAAGAVIQ